MIYFNIRNVFSHISYLSDSFFGVLLWVELQIILMTDNKKTATNKRLTSLLLLLSITAWMWAQEPANPVRMVWKDSTSITVSIPLTASAKEVTQDDRLLFFPTLTGAGGESKELPPVAFAGKRNMKIHKRSHIYDIYKDLQVFEPGKAIVYEETVSVEPWMLSGPIELLMKTELENCCEILATNQSTLASTQYYVYVAPWLPIISDDVRELENMSKYGKLLIPIEDYTAFDPNIALGSDRESESIIFELDKSNINTAFRDNGEKLNRIVEMMDYIQKDSYLEVEKIRIVGAASPEGPYDRNERLAASRVKSLKDYIQSRVPINEKTFETIAIAEAWVDARAAIAASNRTDKEELLTIIDNTPDANKREAMLRKLNSGKTFKELVQTVFADLRLSGRIKVYYSNTHRDLLKRATALYRQKKYQEAYDLLQPIREDSRAFNLLGASGYMAGHKEEARNYFEQGMQAGDQFAATNLKEMPAR